MQHQLKLKLISTTSVVTKTLMKVLKSVLFREETYTCHCHDDVILYVVKTYPQYEIQNKHNLYLTINSVCIITHFTFDHSSYDHLLFAFFKILFKSNTVIFCDEVLLCLGTEHSLFSIQIIL